MRKPEVSRWVLLLGLLVVLGVGVQADVLAAGVDNIDNGDFSGDLTGWTTTGNVEVVTTGNFTSFVSDFPSGDPAVLLSTGPGDDPARSANPQSRQPRPSARDSGVDRDGVNGNENDVSTLSTTFDTTTPGFVCWTIVALLTSEVDQLGNFDDIFEVRINGTPVQQHSVNQTDPVRPTSPFPDYADTFSTLNRVSSSGPTNNSVFRYASQGTTSWQVPVVAGNNQSIEFFVGDAGDDVLDTGLLVDDVRFSPTPCGYDFPWTAATAQFSISGRAFIDQNNNDVRDAGDVPNRFVDFDLLVQGIAFRSFSADDQDATYTLTTIAPGTYQVSVNDFGNIALVTPNQGGDDTIDSDFVPDNPGDSFGEATVTVTGANLNNVDAGFSRGIDDTIFISTQKNRPRSGNILSGFPAGVTIDLTTLVNPTNGTLDLQADGTYTYTPNPDFTGDDEFRFRTTDGVTLFDETTVDIRVFGAVDAQSDNYSTTLDTPLTISAELGLLANDSTASGSPLSVIEFEGEPVPAGGSATVANFAGTTVINSDGSFTFTPVTDFEGSFFFDYVASDGSDQDSGFGSINVSPIQIIVPGPQTVASGANLPFSAAQNRQISVDSPEPDARLSVELDVDRGTISVTGGVQVNNKTVPRHARRPAFQTSNVTVVGNNSDRITVTGPEAEVNVVLETLNYQSNAGFTGIDVLEIVANDGANVEAQAQVNITVVGSTTAGGGGTGSTADGDDPTDAAAIPVPVVQLNAQPDSIIRTNVPPGAVPNGDVFVRLLVVNGQLVVAPNELGDPALVGQSFQQGAEIFGLTFGGASVIQFEAGVQVCLFGVGQILYRDASLIPRQTVALPTTFVDGFTCAVIPNSGTLLLRVTTPDGQPVDAIITTGDAPPPLPQQPERDSASLLPLDDCMVTTQYLMNLRAGPGTDEPVIMKLPYDVTLTAFSRSADGWFEVDYNGTRGWASSSLMTADGACGE